MSLFSSGPKPGFFSRIGKKVADGVRNLWNARRSPNRSLRVAWWTGACIVPILLFAPERVPIALGLWACFNVGIASVCSFWSLLHPRSVWRAKRTVTGFALVMSVFSLSLVFPLQDLVATNYPAFSFSGSALLLAAVFLFPVSLLFCVYIGLMGAGIGAYYARNDANPARGASSAVAGFWISIWVSLLLSIARARPEFYGGILISAPAVAYLAALWARRTQDREPQILRRILLFLDRSLRLHYRTRRKDRILDLRGIVLGLLSGGLLLTSGLMGLFVPLQARLLAAQVAFRSAPLVAMAPTSSLARLLDKQAGEKLAPNYVLLRLDEVTRRQILQSGSEAAMQARILRQLRPYHCRFIVLPAPLLNPSWQPLLQSDTTILPLYTDEVNRTLHDLPDLKQAIRQAGNVLLSVINTNTPTLKGRRFLDTNKSNTSEARRQQDRLMLRSLAQQAAGVGSSTLGSLEIGTLPTIPLGWQRLDYYEGKTGELPSLPFLLLAKERGISLADAWNGTAARSFRLGAQTLPTTTPGEVLVSYFSGEPNTGFPTLNYETILNNTPETLVPRIGMSFVDNIKQMDDSSGHKESLWVRLDTLLRDKVVLLEGLVPEVRQTPIGNLTAPELTAHAVTTLASGSIIHRAVAHPLAQILLTSLVLAALIGQVTLKRTPLQAGWWSLLIASLFVVASLLGFLFLDLWIDMLLPLLASLSAYILTLQYADTVNRWDISRNRAMLERFLDKDTVSRIMAGEELKLGGEKKTICVLFADVRGFSRFASQNPPEEVLSTINAYLTAMSEQVFRYDGFLDKFLGDGMLALFGIPSSRGDDVERAVQAAIAMQEAAARISERMIQEGRQPLGLGIGVHYGEAVFGLVGNIQRPDPTAIGHTVVLGQRIQGTALAGEIVLTEACYRKLGHRANVQAREPVMVKGLADPVRSYRLIELRPADTVVATISKVDEEALLMLGPK